MATIVEPRVSDEPRVSRFVFNNVSWCDYQAMLRIVGNRPMRVTFDRGILELMSPSYNHNRYKNWLRRMVDTVTEELNIPCEPAGSTTWRKQAKERGLEADESFYIANAGRVLGKREIDLSVDPPPDLAIEVEITSSALDRMGIYTALGVPEVWRFDGETLHVHVLQEDGSYGPSESSPSLPFLPLEEAVRWLLRAEALGSTLWGRQLRHWVRAELLPRYEAGRPGP